MLNNLPEISEEQNLEKSLWNYDISRLRRWTQENVQQKLDHNTPLEVLTKEAIKTWLLINYGSVEKLLKINRKKIRVLENPTAGKISQLIKISGWENEQRYLPWSPQGFRSWIRWMYNMPEEKIGKEDIKKFLIEKYHSIEVLLSMNSATIRKIEYPNHGKIIKLGTLSWWKSPDEIALHIPEAFYSWVRWLYKEEE